MVFVVSHMPAKQSYPMQPFATDPWLPVCKSADVKINRCALRCRQPVLGQRSRPRPPPSGYKHLSSEQRAKLDAALAATAEDEADAAEGVRTEVGGCASSDVKQTQLCGVSHSGDGTAPHCCALGGCL